MPAHASPQQRPRHHAGRRYRQARMSAQYTIIADFAVIFRANLPQRGLVISDRALRALVLRINFLGLIDVMRHAQSEGDFIVFRYSVFFRRAAIMRCLPLRSRASIAGNRAAAALQPRAGRCRDAGLIIHALSRRQYISTPPPPRAYAKMLLAIIEDYYDATLFRRL